MGNLLIQLEQRTGLSGTLCGKLLDCPRPTYYQYRRQGQMPGPVRRLVEVLLSLPKTRLNDLIQEYVYDDDDEL